MPSLKTVLVKGKSGQLRINESDLSIYEKKGYEVIKEKPAEEKKEKKKEEKKEEKVSEKPKKPEKSKKDMKSDKK